MKHTEDQIQAACVKWFRYQYPDVVIFAIPNGGLRGAREAARMKGTGTLAGVADLFVMKPARKRIDMYDSWLCHGLFIEMKAGKGTQTESQKAFQEKAMEAGYQYSICRSVDEFMKVVNEYLT